MDTNLDMLFNAWHGGRLGEPRLRKASDTPTIYLANGEQVRAVVNGISPEDESGYVLRDGREIKVMPLPDLFRYLGYGEVVPITLQTGEVFKVVLQPEGYINHVAYLYRKESIEATVCVFDESFGIWREMTDQEYEKERRAWSEDMKDMQQMRQEWREYRDS